MSMVIEDRLQTALQTVMKQGAKEAIAGEVFDMLGEVARLLDEHRSFLKYGIAVRQKNFSERAQAIAAYVLEILSHDVAARNDDELRKSVGAVASSLSDQAIALRDEIVRQMRDVEVSDDRC